MVLVCHVISEDHVINGSYDFMVGSKSHSVIVIVVGEIYLF